MSNPLTFLIPLDSSRVRDILIIQTKHRDLLNGVIQKCREMFPEAYLQALVRESDVDLVRGIEKAHVYPVRWEDQQELWGQRRELLRRFRSKTYDAIVTQFSGEKGVDYFKVLPFLLRCRNIIVFSEDGQYFPLKVYRVHSFLFRRVYGFVGLLLKRLLLDTAALIVLTIFTGYVYLRRALLCLHHR